MGLASAFLICIRHEKLLSSICHLCIFLQDEFHVKSFFSILLQNFDFLVCINFKFQNMLEHLCWLIIVLATCYTLALGWEGLQKRNDIWKAILLGSYTNTVDMHMSQNLGHTFTNYLKNKFNNLTQNAKINLIAF